MTTDWTSSITSGWSLWIIALVTINILGCVWLILWTSKRRPGDPKPDDTGHVWDENITEYNKPLPRWWVNMFYLTIVFSIGYLVWYPGFGAFAGIGGWTSAGEMQADAERNQERLAATFAPYDGKAVDVLAQDEQAVHLGRSIFNNTCATCHGSAGQGAIGYPNLTDDSWQWGGSPDQILTTIRDGRQGVMTPWGDVLTGMGGENAVDYVVAYVRALSDPASLQNNFLAAQGKKLYDGVCVACHGVDGKGNQDLGAPDLTDDVWLYGNSTEAIRTTIQDGRHGVMPPHGELLGDTRTRLVGAYVWSLSHGNQSWAQVQASRPAPAPAAAPVVDAAQPAADSAAEAPAPAPVEPVAPAETAPPQQ
ncbi:MAG: cytochrome-c oxidase, cbb3-type subunit III [Pseudoxanthomonas suwonensis]|nr:cytochrome-c oxidase, cbb3-type subunit III [Pseudoxanthomonas suwonensis]